MPKQWFKKILFKKTSIILILLITQAGYAKPTCNEVLNACDKALKAKETQLQIRDEQLGQAQEMLKANAKEIGDLRRSNDAWYNNKLLWLVVGAGTTAYLLRK